MKKFNNMKDKLIVKRYNELWDIFAKTADEDDDLNLSDDLELKILKQWYYTKIKYFKKRDILKILSFKINNKSSTFLESAIEFKREKTALWLINIGVNLNDVDIYNTPLLNKCCDTNDNLDSIAFELIDNGADLNRKGAYGGTPLTGAASQGKMSLVVKLIDEGADINKQQGNGMTAIMWSCLNGYYDITKKLIDCGACLTIKTNSHCIYRTFLDQIYFKGCENQEIISYLKNKYHETLLECIDKNKKSAISKCFNNPIADFNLINEIVNYAA